jgi:hypothetical protein
MDAVIAATTPLRALGFVAAATTTALGVALLRLLRTPNAPRPTHSAAAAAGCLKRLGFSAALIRGAALG